MAIQVLQDAMGLGQALPQIGASLGQGLAQFGQKRQAKKSGTILDQLLGQMGQEGGPQSLPQAYARALSQGASPDLLNQGVLGSALQKSGADPLEGKSTEEITDLFQRMGMNQERASQTAELYSSSPIGGRTSIVQQVMEGILRTQGGLFKDNREGGTASEGEFDPFYGLTPSERFTRESKFFDLNEPKLEELNKKLSSEQANDLRYERLNEIFTNELDQLPSALTSAFFDFDSESKLSKIGRSQLSGAAQEVIKLTVDMLSGAKDTYGARVTNFDAQQYLKKLPSLLNTPEGKKRVLRDLKILNKINSLEREGILEEFKKAGGTGAIPFSEAQRRGRKNKEKEIMELRKQFIRPNNKNFSALPDPSIYKGRRVQDEKTGQIFISDGSEWKLKGDK